MTDLMPLRWWTDDGSPDQLHLCDPEADEVEYVDCTGSCIEHLDRPDGMGDLAWSLIVAKLTDGPADPTAAGDEG
jgi:hypothetical protein